MPAGVASDGWCEMTRPIPVVGQQLVAVPCGNAARFGNRDPYAVLVVSVGRKYFYVARPDQQHNRHGSYRVNVETWHTAENYSCDFRLYATTEEYEEHKFREAAYAELREKFGRWSASPEFSTESLRACLDVLGLKVDGAK